MAALVAALDLPDLMSCLRAHWELIRQQTDEKVGRLESELMDDSQIARLNEQKDTTPFAHCL